MSKSSSETVKFPTETISSAPLNEVVISFPEIAIAEIVGASAPGAPSKPSAPSAPGAPSKPSTPGAPVSPFIEPPETQSAPLKK